MQAPPLLVDWGGAGPLWVQPKPQPRLIIVVSYLKVIIESFKYNVGVGCLEVKSGRGCHPETRPVANGLRHRPYRWLVDASVLKLVMFK